MAALTEQSVFTFLPLARPQLHILSNSPATAAVSMPSARGRAFRSAINARPSVSRSPIMPETTTRQANLSVKGSIQIEFQHGLAGLLSSHLPRNLAHRKVP